MSGKPQRSREYLILTGQFRPDRRASRGQAVDEPLGPPPRYLEAEARHVWREVAAAAGWLRRPDRDMLELYAKLMAKARADLDVMPAAKISLLARLGSKLGLSPADRANIPQPKKPAAPNPFAAFDDL